jgi:hypothetical protein
MGHNLPSNSERLELVCLCPNSARERLFIAHFGVNHFYYKGASPTSRIIKAFSECITKLS